jgi:hypothetical protein
MVWETLDDKRAISLTWQSASLAATINSQAPCLINGSSYSIRCSLAPVRTLGGVRLPRMSLRFVVTPPRTASSVALSRNRDRLGPLT